MDAANEQQRGELGARLWMRRCVSSRSSRAWAARRLVSWIACRPVALRTARRSKSPACTSCLAADGSGWRSRSSRCRNASSPGARRRPIPRRHQAHGAGQDSWIAEPGSLAEPSHLGRQLTQRARGEVGGPRRIPRHQERAGFGVKTTAVGIVQAPG